eukprot:s893_g1.t1
MVRLVRSRPQKTDQLAQFWHATSWKLALEMRSGKTFAETTAVLMKDYDAFTECMSREPTQIKKPSSTQPRQELKGQGKGNTKSGKPSRPTPYSRPSRNWGQPSSERYDRTSTSWQSYPRPEDKSWAKDSWAADWKSNNVILLSCFDGIGTAALILNEITAGISLHISWEVDPDCLTIIKKHYPQAHHRGDFLEDDPLQVAKIICDHDPTGQMLIIFAAAPPCPDFSRIREDAPGAAGSEGQKFTAYCKFANRVEMQLPHKRVGHLTENVVMERGEADFFSSRLDCNAVAADAQDYGLINRPRLWRFAPWQYAEEALLHAKDGTMVVPPPAAKEQLHQLPVDYTKADGVSERARHRLLANGWHVGSAKFLMLLVIQMAMNGQAAEIPMSPRSTALQQMMAIVSRMEPSIGPGSWQLDPSCVPKVPTMWEHWQQAKVAQHPLLRAPSLEPGLQQCQEIQRLVAGSINRMRTEIIAEIASLAEERMPDTSQWWLSLPRHIAQVYFDQEHKQISQIPLLLELLEMTGMPGLELLSKDLQQGFQILGQLNPGAGWMPRADQKYEFPVDPASFKKNNRHYALAKLKSKRVDPEWTTMRDELKGELEKGRMSGPYSAPTWWPMPAASIDGLPLQPLDNEDICISFCFSVKQSDKVRRCEDFRRSGHNSTVIAHDVPHHHDIKVFTDLALSASSESTGAKIWAQDLNGAYRQFPVREPNDCFCVLMTPEGPILMRHHALMFGAASSVWNFNRAADAITFLSRRILATSVGHYVDDFIGIEAEETVQSGFESFAQLSMGARATHERGQGIGSEFDTEGEQAQKLAGKLIFLTSTLFGQLGRAALQPIYARAHGQEASEKGDQLNWPLRSALRTLQGLLQQVQPRVVPRSIQQPSIIIYTDAYFVLNGEKVSVGSDQVPTQWSKYKCPTYENGWGYVIHFQDETYFASGTVPSWLLKKFCSRKAYIYFLEVLAQLIALISCARLTSKLLISFIDNTSGYFALRKGYCKDENICNMIALTWRVIAFYGWHIHLEWVASELNISDQVSRHNFDQMRHLGAHQERPPVDELFRILFKVAGDSDYAHGKALEDVIAISSAPDITSHWWFGRSGASAAG